MHTIIKNNNEKALFYANFNMGRFYSGSILFGVVLSLLSFFFDRPNYTVFFTPFVGYFFAYMDNNIISYLIIQRPHMFARKLERLDSFRVRLGFEPVSSVKHIKLLSMESLKLSFSGFSMLYESYKWFLLLLLLIISFFISGKKSGAVIFNGGLNIFFWGIFYIKLWRKKYFRLCAKKLGLTDEQFIAIRDYGKNSGA